MDDNVRAQVEQLAAGSFADPTDAPMYLDASKYGETPDPDVITADLAAVLEAKPYLAKAIEPEQDLVALLAPFGVRPMRNGHVRPVDTTLAAELAPYGLKPRSGVSRPPDTSLADELAPYGLTPRSAPRNNHRS